MILSEPQHSAFLQFLRDIYYKTIIRNSEVVIPRKDAYLLFCRNCNEKKTPRVGKINFYNLMRDFGFGEKELYKGVLHETNFVFEKTLLKKTIDESIYKEPEEPMTKLAIKVGGEWHMITIICEPMNKQPITINDNLTVKPDNIQA